MSSLWLWYCWPSITCDFQSLHCLGPSCCETGRVLHADWVAPQSFSSSLWNWIIWPSAGWTGDLDLIWLTYNECQILRGQWQGNTVYYFLLISMMLIILILQESLHRVVSERKGNKKLASIKPHCQPQIVLALVLLLQGCHERKGNCFIYISPNRSVNESTQA